MSLEFCEQQIAAWSKRADELRAVLNNTHNPCSVDHVQGERGAIMCPVCVSAIDSGHASAQGIATSTISDEQIDALQHAITLCEMQAEEWRARARGTAGGRPRGAA